MIKNKITKNLKRKYSQEEKNNFCTAWEQSGVSQIDFCKAHGVSRSAFCQWLKEFKKESKALDFSPLIIEEKTAAASTELMSLNIGFANHSLQLSLVIPEHRLVSFILEIGYAITIVR